MSNHTTIANVYPVARAFGFGEPVEETAFPGLSGSTTYGMTVFAKGGLKVSFYSTNGVVDEVAVARGESFLATSMDDAVQVGLRALAGVDVLDA